MGLKEPELQFSVGREGESLQFSKILNGVAFFVAKIPFQPFFANIREEEGGKSEARRGSVVERRVVVRFHR